MLQELGSGGRLGGRRVSLVFRTFGCDMPRVAAAVAAYSEGKHPLFPRPTPLPAPDLWSGRYSPDGAFELMGGGELDGAMRPRPWAAGGLRDEAAALALQRSFLSGVRDDYAHWRGSAYLPASGKPLWITLDDRECPPAVSGRRRHLTCVKS